MAEAIEAQRGHFCEPDDNQAKPQTASVSNK
jgi:hypothetical protein